MLLLYSYCLKETEAKRYTQFRFIRFWKFSCSSSDIVAEELLWKINENGFFVFVLVKEEDRTNFSSTSSQKTSQQRIFVFHFVWDWMTLRPFLT